MFLLPRCGSNLDTLDLNNAYALGTRILNPELCHKKNTLQVYWGLIVKNTYVKLYLVSLPVVACKVWCDPSDWMKLRTRNYLYYYISVFFSPYFFHFHCLPHHLSTLPFPLCIISILVWSVLSIFFFFWDSLWSQKLMHSKWENSLLHESRDTNLYEAWEPVLGENFCYFACCDILCHILSPKFCSHLTNFGNLPNSWVFVWELRSLATRIAENQYDTNSSSCAPGTNSQCGPDSGTPGLARPPLSCAAHPRDARRNGHKYF